jgi:hypothetical protein
MSSDKDLREDVEEMRNALKEATERLRALEHKVAVATDRIIYIGACEQKLRDIRDDLDVVRAKLSVLPNASADVRCTLLRTLQEELAGGRLQEIQVRYLGSYFECLRRISASIREDMLNSRDVSEWAVRHVRQVFDEWCRQTEQEEEERQRSESDADE